MTFKTDFIFYKSSKTLHDIQKEGFNENSIDPAINQKYLDNEYYNNFDNTFIVKNIVDIINSIEDLQYLAEVYPEDLIKALVD